VSTRVPLCSNGHKFCEPCQTQVHQTRSWRDGHAHCPLCREAVPYHAPPPGAAPLPPLHPVLPDANREQVNAFLTNRSADHREAYAEFLTNRRTGRIPPESVFGGIHNRCCGDRRCNRRGGREGVRFLLWNNTDHRRYRCDEHQNE